MADKETGLNITVGAVADEKSAEQAVNKIVKKVDGSVKGGRIEVPVDITVPIDETKSKLTKAQKDITSEISKLMSKGFSASGKDIDALNSKLDKFMKTAREAGKDNRNPIVKAISQQVKDLQNQYKEMIKVEKSTKDYQTKIKNSSKPKSRGKKQFSLPSDEEIEANIKQHKARQYKGVATTGPKGFKTNSGFDTGVATSKTILDTDRGGSYESKWAQQMARSLAESKKADAKTLTVTIDKELANKMADAAERNGNNKNKFSPEDKAKGIASAILPELSRVLGGIQNGRPDASPEKFFQMLEAVLKLNQDAGMKALDNAMSVLDRTMRRWFNTAGTLGVGDGEDKIDKTRAPHVESVLKEMIARIEKLEDKIIAETVALEEATKVEKEKVKTATKNKKTSTSGIAENSIANKVLTDIANSSKEQNQKLAEEIKKGNNKDNKSELNKLNTSINNIKSEVKTGTKATNTQTTYDKMDNVKKDTDEAKHRQVDETNRDINKDVARSVKADETSGFNTDTKADRLIELVEEILRVLKPKETKESTKKAFTALNSGKDVKLLGDGLKKSLGEIYKDAIEKGKTPEQAHKIIADESNKRKGKKDEPREPITNGTEPPRGLRGEVPPPPEPEPYQNKVEKSTIIASPIKRTIRDAFQNFMNDITGASKMYKETVNASNEEQDRMSAERVRIWGMNNGRNPNDTGDIAAMRRILELYRNNKSSIEQNPELMQKIKLTDGVKIDTTEITKAFNKALSGKQMRNAQMGGSPIQQVLGAMRGFTFMPSIEKSRAQADGLNQILGNINKALNSVLANIQMHETTLAGMEKAGDVEFDDNGYITKGTSAAKKTLADLEESKYVLETIMADLQANEKIIKRTGNNYSQMVKQLSFTSPVLRDNNATLRNMNAGLDKNGKALKFQTRMAEILNYTFQLIGRSIGQWFKKLISMLNPLNILKNTIKTITGWIKSAFQDFGSYDTKWKRTMNVIKINFQRAIKPAMEWIAQQLVNIIGFFNIISMKVQEAFGQVPVDLFDQAGANAEKIRRELEEAANVTAGFDELHDIGSDNSGENDLLGDIYKPQLSQEWIDMANEIGDLFAGLIKGEKTVGEVFGRIFEMLLELLGKIAKVIWDWFKETSFGKWIIANWKKVLAAILAAFLAWELLKIAGPTLLKALWGWITGSKIGELFKTLGVKFMDVFTSTQFGSDFVRGIKAMFNSGGMIGTFKAGGASLGAIFAQALVAVIGVAIAGFSIAKGFDIVADDTSYNLGYDDYGGRKDEDKKSGAGGMALGTLGGAAGGALAGLAIGGPIGAAIGAVIGGLAGLITTALAPAFEELEIAARKANNEMQKIEYYEGAVKGAQSQTDMFSEQLDLLKQSLELNTQAVYDQGEKLGISKSRMDELVKATQDGTFTTDMLTGSETQLAGSLTDLMQKQEHTTEVTKKLEEAQRKLLKAQTELSIAQDVEAGNFEIAAARIELAEAQGVYSTEEATKKRIQLYKQGGEEERKNLLQNLTQEQRTKMAEYYGVTEKELDELSKIWQESSDDVKKALLEGVGTDTQNKFQQEMNSIDSIIRQHQGFWQGVGDTLAEIFTFGNANTWTYNGEAKYNEEAKKGKYTIRAFEVGTNYVPNDGLAYLHQGEAVIPKKYNQPYQPTDYSGMENALNSLTQQVTQISNQVNQGIAVKGQFVQRGSDLVATVEKANNRMSNSVLNNKVYAR